MNICRLIGLLVLSSPSTENFGSEYFPTLSIATSGLKFKMGRPVTTRNMFSTVLSAIPQAKRVLERDGLTVDFCFKASFSNVLQILVEVVNHNSFQLKDFVMDLQVQSVSLFNGNTNHKYRI